MYEAALKRAKPPEKVKYIRLAVYRGHKFLSSDSYQRIVETMNENAEIEIRLQSEDSKLLEKVKNELQERWPFAFASELSQNERDPRVGWWRVYLQLRLPVPEEEAVD